MRQFGANMKANIERSNEFIDPICGMTVTPETAAGSLEVRGETYYFCSKGCL